MSQHVSTAPAANDKVVKVLETLLADEHILLLQTRSAHWNVEGPDFYQMHTFFENQYGQLDKVIDEIAERIRMQGCYAIASYEKYSRLSQIKNKEVIAYNSTAFLQQLLDSHIKIIDSLRIVVKCIADELDQPGTADFITGVLSSHEKMTWMIRSHLKQSGF